ncbi:MAG: hypothetical protein S4CHLAM81_03170 [Chlamydiales bacterium]|nr:hypothetical protein [Chlamydiales bacterium]MCH9635107.1 hypothetical protein [Chlamydiales bacterium]
MVEGAIFELFEEFFWDMAEGEEVEAAIDSEIWLEVETIPEFFLPILFKCDAILGIAQKKGGYCLGERHLSLLILLDIVEIGYLGVDRFCQF